MDYRLYYRVHAFPLALLMVAGIAGVDYITGTSIRIFPLYFGPIALAARYGTPRTASLIPWVCTAAWLMLNAPATRSGSPLLTWVINTCMQGISFITVAMLLKQLRMRLEREQELSLKDPLTGLFNHRAFFELGNGMMAGAERTGQPVTVAYLDLDNFKQVNDTLGHAEGDRVLEAVGGVLKTQLRASDLSARLGGDEFALILANTGSHGAELFLRRLRLLLLERLEREGWPVTMSVGAIGYQKGPVPLQDALRRADALMYMAKHGGKNQLRIEAEDRASEGTSLPAP